MSIVPYRTWTPKIAGDAFVAPNATVIGNVEIGRGSGIWFNVVLRGDVHEIRIGENTNIQDGSVVHVSRNYAGTYIGSNITIGHMAVLHGCRLEDGAFIGMRACIMDDVVVEGGAMVAAGALVTPGKRVKAGQLWAGSPAQPMRELRAEELDHMRASAVLYSELAQEYRKLRS